MRRLGSRRKRIAISGIVAALILFVILFTVGSGYFLWVNDLNLSSSQALISRNNGNLAQQSENLILVPSVQDPVGAGSPINVNITNAGSSPVEINSIFVTGLTDAVLRTCTTICEFGINPDGSASSIITGYNYQPGTSVRIKAITESGNVFSTTYMSPTISTALSSASVPAGDFVSDSARLDGAYGTASGTVTYFVSSTNTCPNTGAIQVGDPVSVLNGVVPDSLSQSYNTPGTTYYWYAVYSGDAYDAPATSACEPLAIGPAIGVTITTQLSAVVADTGSPVYDTATLSGATSNAGGTVTYFYFSGMTCSGTPTTVGTVTVASGVVPASPSVSYVTAGGYSWYAVYSGDVNNNNNVPVTSPCEPLSILGSGQQTQFPFAVSLSSFRFYFAAVCAGVQPPGQGSCVTPGYNDPAQLGDGYPVGGYFAYVVPSETQEFDVVYQLKVTNVDPSGRDMTLNSRSFAFLCALASSGNGYGNGNACSYQFESNEYYIVGDLLDTAPYRSGVTVKSFTNEWPNGFTIPPGGSALVNFTTPTTGGSVMEADTPDDPTTPYLLFPFLEGSYSDGTPFTLTLASTSVFGSTSSFTACNPSTCAGSPGSLIELTMSGFSSTPKVYWFDSSGTTLLSCATGQSCTSTSEWFNIPSGASVGGYYTVFATDGENYAYATVFVGTLTPPLVAPTISVHPTTINGGQSATLSTTASFSGGASPYSCQWLEEAPGATSYSNLGSSFSCNAGNTPTAQTGTLSATGMWNFELQVTDSSSPVQVVTSNTVGVRVMPAFIPPVISVSPTTANSGQSASLSTTTSFSGGTAPYTCQWLREAPGATSYSNLGGQFGCDAGDTPSRSTNTLFTSGIWSFELQVTDNSGAMVTSNTVTVTVYSALTAGSITPSAPGIDSGQSISLSASWTGGTSTYTVTWYSGGSANCAGDTTVVATHTGVSASPDTESVAPTANTHYCAVITDSSTPVQSATDAAITVTVYSALTAGSIAPPAPVIDSGQSVTLSASWTGGTSTFTVTWYSGSSATCSSDTTVVATNTDGASPNSQSVTPTTNTHYCAVITDSSSGTPAQSATDPAILVTVDPMLNAGTLSATQNPVEVGQMTTISTSGASGGSGPGTYSYAWTGLPPGCSTSNTPSINCTPTSHSGSPYTVTLTVTDANGGTATATLQLRVNSALSVSLSANPATIGSGQTSTLTATASGGSGTYTIYTFYSGSSCTGTAVQTGSSNMYTTSGLSSTAIYCVQVTDSLGGTATDTVTVDVASLTISPISISRSTSSSSARTVTLSGSGYSGGITYNYCLSTSSTTIGCVTGTNGNFSPSGSGGIPSGTTFTLPRYGAPTGTYYVIVYTGTTILAAATLTVTT
jgi:hypothetical protein